jgi:hypothetical protein
MLFWYKSFLPQEYTKELTKQRAHNIYACGTHCFLFGTKQISSLHPVKIFIFHLIFIGPCIVIYSQPTRCTCYLKLFILVKRCTCFGRSFRPSSGAQYSNGICQTAAATCCYRGWDGTQFHLIPDSSSCLTYVYRCCIRSFELLMMDGKTVRNM